MGRRGTTNRNVRGNTRDRLARRRWLVRTFRANVDVMPIGKYARRIKANAVGAVPACRCYRCGRLLTEDVVTVDRIVPGCRGGTYRRNNIRPACASCNSETGGSVRRTA